MLKTNKMGLLYIIIVLVTSCTRDFDKIGHTNSESLSEMTCYNSFEEFAYILPDTYSRDPLLPTNPWRVEATFPSELAGDYHIGGLGIEVMFARSIDEKPEIWFSRPLRFKKEDIKSVLIYRPATKEWLGVSDIVVGTDIFISDIFLANDGTIWGRNMWEGGGRTNPDKGPVLSKFNEQTQQFEFALGALEIPFSDEQRFLHKIIIDQQNKIWIFVANDGIYQYDPILQTTIKRANLPDINISSPTLSIDGTIYFQDNDFKKLSLGNPSFRIFEGILYQFFPDSGQVLKLEIPGDPWPMFGKMLVTPTGQIWLGAVGYIDLDDNIWHLMHPDPARYFENGGEDAAASPSPFLESSDGSLWFNKYSGIYEGTAWYDSETGEGCMFTNIPANIIEDTQQQLWMFADGKLYRYSLNE
jgi:hypothetical protein